MKLKNWKVLAAALGAAVIVGGFNAASIAGLAASATVLDTCNVRSEASATSSAVTQASKDSTVEVGDPVTNDAGETWYPVTLSDGTTGYIKSNLLNIEETASTTTDTTTTDTTTTDTTADTTGDTSADTSADGTDASESADTAASADVPTAQGEGYAQAMTPTNATVSSDVNVRAGAGTDYTKIGELTAGTTLVAIGQAKDSNGDIWYQFYTTGTDQQMTGFIRYDYITLGDPVQTAQTDTSSQDTSEDASQDSTEKPDYEAVYADDGSGTSEWYLYNNVTNTRKKISDMESAVDEANTLVTEAQSSVSHYRMITILFGVLFAVSLIAVIFLILNLRRAKAEGGEVDLMTIRQKQERRRRLEEREQEKEEERKPSLRERNAGDRASGDRIAADRPVRRPSDSPRSGQGREVRSQDRGAYATRRTQDDSQDFRRSPGERASGAAGDRYAGDRASADRAAGERTAGERVRRTSASAGSERMDDRQERRSAERTQTGSRQPVRTPQSRPAAQNFAGVDDDDDDDLQFLNMDDDDKN
ncbi:MAG: SH3 domain-containing protein [Lachnospiraceae bacterium]|nr:SH3 domain-containing protein [Lachnospiraceae bacterium]